MSKRLWLAGLAVCALVACTIEQTESDDGDDPATTGSTTGAGVNTSGAPASSGAGAAGATTTTGSTTTTSSTTGGGGGSTDCLYSSGCPVDEVCVCPNGPDDCAVGTCALAWGRVWNFKPAFAQVPGTDPATQQAWDTSGGAPDLFVEVYGGSTMLGSTSVIDNDFSPFWTDPPAQAVVNSDGVDIIFYMYDEDTLVDDYVTGFSGPPSLFLNVVKQDAGIYEWVDGQISLTVFVTVL